MSTWMGLNIIVEWKTIGNGFLLICIDVFIYSLISYLYWKFLLRRISSYIVLGKYDLASLKINNIKTSKFCKNTIKKAAKDRELILTVMKNDEIQFNLLIENNYSNKQGINIDFWKIVFKLINNYDMIEVKTMYDEYILKYDGTINSKYLNTIFIALKGNYNLAISEFEKIKKKVNNKILINYFNSLIYNK